MTAPPGLWAEDRPDFERALRTAEIRGALRRNGATGDADVQRLCSRAPVESEAFATAAAAFLLLGGLLKLFPSQCELAEALLTAGLTSATIAAVTLAAGVACLLATAVRHRTSSAPDQHPRAQRLPYTYPPHIRRRDDAAVATARDAWLRTLLHRGILPFLRDRLKMSQSPSRMNQKSEKGST
ncbi:hypothetical protein [Streptomyces yatensis]|uniref:Transmembrane protein n=1 Tax=Streptomyces yatensis TaxID=155177 RepID=A0ABN2IRX7_9ACTN|nr:hypothetical protein [Streptomyces yatensis]